MREEDAMAARSRLVLLIGGVLMVGSLPAHAMAGVPVVNEHEKFSVTFPDEVCGIPVITVIRGVDTFRVFDDGTFLYRRVHGDLHRRERGVGDREQRGTGRRALRADREPGRDPHVRRSVSGDAGESLDHRGPVLYLDAGPPRSRGPGRSTRTGSSMS
jgi:hypothetical protein